MRVNRRAGGTQAPLRVLEGQRCSERTDPNRVTAGGVVGVEDADDPWRDADVGGELPTIKSFEMEGAIAPPLVRCPQGSAKQTGHIPRQYAILPEIAARNPGGLTKKDAPHIPRLE